ncbi:DUF5819 family protein [Streptomyces sp. NPDC020681]|uniref:DUF5819 family protein n=1 Tax=Streptomyces sp. NPDC020681 TaxID=3365083 RepID=UPI0037B9AE9F
MTGTQSNSSRVRSGPATAVLVSAAVIMLGAVAWHAAAVFLSLAPENGISQRYKEQIDEYARPAFARDWKLFAPNPLQENTLVSARVESQSPDGRRQIGSWVDLTGQDVAAIRGNPLPSHVHQNLLRRAWDFYAKTHDLRDGRRVDRRGDLSEQYLKRIALQRFGRGDSSGTQTVAIQFRQQLSPVQPPRWDTRDAGTDGRVRAVAPATQPWWPVREHDYEGLGL